MKEKKWCINWCDFHINPMVICNHTASMRCISTHKILTDSQIDKYSKETRIEIRRNGFIEDKEVA